MLSDLSRLYQHRFCEMLNHWKADEEIYIIHARLPTSKFNIQFNRTAQNCEILVQTQIFRDITTLVRSKRVSQRGNYKRCYVVIHIPEVLYI